MFQRRFGTVYLLAIAGRSTSGAERPKSGTSHITVFYGMANLLVEVWYQTKPLPTDYVPSCLPRYNSASISHY